MYTSDQHKILQHLLKAETMTRFDVELPNLSLTQTYFLDLIGNLIYRNVVRCDQVQMTLPKGGREVIVNRYEFTPQGKNIYQQKFGKTHE